MELWQSETLWDILQVIFFTLLFVMITLAITGTVILIAISDKTVTPNDQTPKQGKVEDHDQD